MYTLEQICTAVTAVLNDKQFSERLRRPQYRNRPDLGGFCYIASEAVYHLNHENYNAPLRVMYMMWENDSHWLLYDVRVGDIIDLTYNQFQEQPDYSQANYRYFRFPSPSKRAQKLMAAARNMLEHNREVEYNGRTAPEFYTKPVKDLNYDDIPW